MRKLLVVVLVSALFLGISFTGSSAKTLEDIKKSGKIVIGVKGDYPPWGTINEKNEFEGWEIDLCHKLAEDLFGNPNAVEFVAVSGPNRIPFLQTEKVDIIWASLGITPDRGKVIDFSIPYFKSGVKLLVKKNSTIKSIQDLSGKTVITIKGSTGSQGLAELVPNAEQLKFDKTSEALQALRDDRAVAFAQDDILLYKLVEEYPDWQVVGESFNVTPWAVGCRKGEDSIRNYLDEFLTKIKKSGYLDESMKKWWTGPGSAN
jgi:polar amino acid transport system substrate-binding protein